jgi:hypothetical protein
MGKIVWEVKIVKGKIVWHVKIVWEVKIVKGR